MDEGPEAEGHHGGSLRLFAALFLLSLAGIAIYFVLDLLSRLILRNWHESALTGEEE